MGINRIAASMYTKVKGKLSSLTKIKSNYKAIYSTFKSIKCGLTRDLAKWTNSKLGRSLASASSKSISSTVSKILPFLDIGLGIWDVLNGKEKLRGGMSHVIRESAKTLNYQVDTMVGAYKELMGKPKTVFNLYS